MTDTPDPLLLLSRARMYLVGMAGLLSADPEDIVMEAKVGRKSDPEKPIADASMSLQEVLDGIEAIVGPFDWEVQS